MTYVISDLHGYRFEDFIALLESAGLGEDDTLYILGDVIDRGDDAAFYLQWLLTAKNTVFILGNHEHMMLKCDFIVGDVTNDTLDLLSHERVDDLRLWLYNGAQQTISGLYVIERKEPGITAKIFEYLRRAPLYAEVSAGGRDYVLVHGGLGNFSPDKPLADYTDSELVWTRPSVNDRYYDDKLTVFGHTPTIFYGREHTGGLLRTDTWIDIDAGCAAGLPPLLLRLDDMVELRPEGYEKKIADFLRDSMV